MSLLDGLIGIVILIFSAILHEIAHGYVADKLGDPTARLYGRLTLDPRKHIDPIGTILLPLLFIISNVFGVGGGIFFAWAKPVPVDPYNLREGRKDVALVSLSGPLTNIILAVIATIILKSLAAFTQSVPLEVVNILSMIISYNVFLAIFNLLPIPPLDGSKVVALLLPERAANEYLALGRFGMIFVFFLIVFYGSFLSTLYSFALKLLGL
jgi:Zn-dependent protease